MILRCCKDSLASWKEKLRGTYEGLEVPCRWCDGFWRFEHGTYQHHELTTDFIARESSADATEARKARIREVLGHDLPPVGGDAA